MRYKGKLRLSSSLTTRVGAHGMFTIGVLGMFRNSGTSSGLPHQPKPHLFIRLESAHPHAYLCKSSNVTA